MRVKFLSLVTSSAFLLFTAVLCNAQGPNQNASITLQKVSPSSEGLKATVVLTHAKVMWLKIYTQDPSSGDYVVPFLPWTNIPIPGAQLDTANSSATDITIPVVTPDSSKSYQIRLYVASNVDANGGSSSYVASDALRFNGFSPPQITKSFGLKIDQSALTVSAKTDIVANLKA